MAMETHSEQATEATQLYQNLAWNTSSDELSQQEHIGDLISEVSPTLQQIELYGSLIIIPVGLILNAISFVVFYKCKTHRTPTGLHLVCIAVADDIMLVGQFLYRSQFWIDYIDIPNFVILNNILCKGSFAVTHFGIFWSGMLLASATVERFVSIAFALRVKTWNLLRISQILITFYFLLCFSFAAAFYYVMEIISYGGITSCMLDPVNLEYFDLLNMISKTVISNGICAGLIVIFTVLISILLYNSKRQRNRLSQGNTDQSDKEFRISLMLTLVAALFIVLRFPEILAVNILVYYQYKRPSKIFDDAMYIYPIVNLLVTINHSLNFIIYFTFFQTFREKFSGVFCKKHKFPQAIKENSTGNTSL